MVGIFFYDDSFIGVLLSHRRAIIELIFAGTLWGFGFVATVWALKIMSPSEVLVIRFLFAFLIGEIIHYFIYKNKKIKSVKEPGFWGAGFFLAGNLLFQTIGLQFTTATNSAFLTCLYVVLVPILSALLFKQKIAERIYFHVFIALIGSFLLMNTFHVDLNKGDLWTIACAFWAAGHILYIGHVTKKVNDSFRFNNRQSLAAFLFLTPLLLLNPKIIHNNWSSIDQNTIVYALIGLFIVSCGSSLLAFFIQVRTQKYLSPSTASMLFLLESPIALFFGFLFLQEKLAGIQIVGCCLIILAAILQIRWETKRPIKAR